MAPPMTEPDQSYEAKLARAVAVVTKQLQPRIDALRLVGPFMPTMPPQYQHMAKHRDNDMVIGMCNFCNPPPKIYKCPKCDWETDVKWKMKLHNDLEPRWCQERYNRKVRKWAQHA